ncbi:hypothetical protein EVAR_69962_1 [Eumeta japonica]|uniref:Uncharacterized protein n=1 Tax=Eumeta variegata TaxID=151549 RepID=A0A4C2AEW6_EUMVA|nr:hypothetical protein EVAR_69962_1 [Eumeta japonica]
MIDIQVARELELQGHRETMTLQWLNKQSVSQDTERVDLTISGSFGIKPNTKQLVSVDESNTLSILKETTKELKIDLNVGYYGWKMFYRFRTLMIWHNRLNIIERKMARDLEYGNEYRQKIEEYLSKGYARKLDESEILTGSEDVFYLPHFGVKTQNKKGIRIMFDAASEGSPIAVCGDIKEMFHQIKTAVEDQNS